MLTIPACSLESSSIPKSSRSHFVNAGVAILDQEVQIGGLKKDIDRLSEENDNLRRMISSKDDTE